MLKSSVCLFLTTLSLAIASPALAQNSAQTLTRVFEDDGWVLGGGVVADSSPYRETSDLEISPIPYIAWDRGPLHIGIDGISYELIDSDALSFEVLAQPRWTFSAPDDSELFRDIDRDTGIDAGGSANLDMGFVYLTATGLADISNVYSGYEASFKIGSQAQIGSAYVDIGAGFRHRDNKLNLHLYGVRPEESSADLVAYAPKSSTEPFVEMTLAYPLGRNTALIGFAEYNSLSQNVQNSPLIDEGWSANAGFAILRRF